METIALHGDFAVCELRRVGLTIREVIPLDPQRHRALRWPWLFGRLRANGWIVVSAKA